MKRWFQNLAPAHRILASAGAVVFCAWLAAGCEKGARMARGSDRTLELSGDTIELPKGVVLHDVQVKAAQNTDFSPTQITAGRVDVVRFTVRDTRTHGLVITGPSAQATAVLDATSQRRSPPLVSKGQSWVVSLKGLPAGTYRITCVGHAGTATLVIQ
ncbi:MAG TPA: plastocyanin/azurin family copper-binding protein [Longimicrobiales bacterium]